MSSLKNGRHLPDEHGTNLFSAAICPVKRWMSRFVLGFGMLMKDFSCSRLASIPRIVTTTPKNLPDTTANTHVFGFRCMQYSMINLRHLPRCPIWSSAFSTSPICRRCRPPLSSRSSQQIFHLQVIETLLQHSLNRMALLCRIKFLSQ